MKLSKTILGLLLLANCLLSSCNKDKVASTYSPSYETNFTPAKTSNELTALRSNINVNMIRSLVDFDNIVARFNTPLNKLSKVDLTSFRKSLVARQGQGIVSIDYSKIKLALTYDEFAVIMKYFGLDIKEGFWGLSNNQNIIQALSFSPSTAPMPDHKEYYCLGPGNCAKKTDCICLSGC